MQKIAIGWLTWSMTESNFWLGVVACADLLPIVLLSPAAGVAPVHYWDTDIR